MRTQLGKALGERKRFSASIDRIGKRVNFKGYSEETLLLKNICEAGTSDIITDHLWIPFSATIEKARIKVGDRIEFDARVRSYQKGYVNRALNLTKRQADFKLSHLTRIVIVSSPQAR